MDLKPEIGYRLFKDEDESKRFKEHMETHWSGTVQIAGYATKAELLKFIEDNHIELDEVTTQNVHNDNYYNN